MNTTKPHYASVYNIPERPQSRTPEVSPLRYVEDSPTTDNEDADEEHYLEGYGEISLSEQYDVVDAGEGEQGHRVLRLRLPRPRSRYQIQPATRPDSVLFEPEYFRHILKGASTDRPATQDMDFRTFFENLRNAPRIRRQRTLAPPNSPASEAADACPRSN